MAEKNEKYETKKRQTNETNNTLIGEIWEKKAKEILAIHEKKKQKKEGIDGDIHFLFLGARESGKTDLIHQILGNKTVAAEGDEKLLNIGDYDDPVFSLTKNKEMTQRSKKHCHMYYFARRNTGKQSTDDRSAVDTGKKKRNKQSNNNDSMIHIWELGGDALLHNNVGFCKELISAVISPPYMMNQERDNLSLRNNTVFIITIDLSKPSYQTIKYLFHSIGAISHFIRPNAKETEENQSTNTFRYPKVLVVGTKYDIFKERYDITKRRIFTKTLRFIAHVNNASLIFCRKNDESKRNNNFRSILKKVLFSPVDTIKNKCNNDADGTNNTFPSPLDNNDGQVIIRDDTWEQIITSNPQNPPSEFYSILNSKKRMDLVLEDDLGLNCCYSGDRKEEVMNKIRLWCSLCKCLFDPDC